jgi:hypothetical protein
LVGSIYGKSSVVIAHFIPIRLQKWPPQAILVSEWPIFENLGQMLLTDQDGLSNLF